MAFGREFPGGRRTVEVKRSIFVLKLFIGRVQGAGFIAQESAKPDEEGRGVTLDGELTGHDIVIHRGQGNLGQKSMGPGQALPAGTQGDLSRFRPIRLFCHAQRLAGLSHAGLGLLKLPEYRPGS